MSNKVKIAIDAMSGENSPNKIIEGIEISLKSSQENFFYLFGQKELLEKKFLKINSYKNIVRLLIPKILFWMMRVPWALLKEEKIPVCGKL